MSVWIVDTTRTAIIYVQLGFVVATCMLLLKDFHSPAKFINYAGFLRCGLVPGVHGEEE